MKQRFDLASVGLLGLILCNGCCSIVSRSSGPVTVTSSPSGATVTITDKRGIEIAKNTTPTTLNLRYDSGYFSRAHYSFQFEKEGYRSSSTQASSDLNAWYFGNILFGGVIGMLIVDPATGAMWKMDDVVCGTLSPVPRNKTAEAPASTMPLAPNDKPREDSTEKPTAVSTAQPIIVAEQQDDVAAQLKKLKELKDAGILTDEEYETRRKVLVARLMQ